MWFKTLEIKNFQIHQKLKVQFTPRVNVIVGESDYGKSAILRALRLLLENTPRKANKIYKNWYSKKPISISLTDSDNHIIKRVNNTYTIDNGKPLSAIGTGPVKEVKNLISMQRTNWHRQLAPHFLIMSTGGEAAKILNSAVGLALQEPLVKEVKRKMLDCKHELKRLTINEDESKNIILQLQKIPELLSNAKELKKTKNEIAISHTAMENIYDIVEKITEITNNMEQYKTIPSFLKRVTDIQTSTQGFNKSSNYTKRLNSLIDKITSANEKSKSINIDKISKYIKTTENTIQNIQDTKEIIEATNQMNKIIKTLKQCNLNQESLSRRTIIEKQKYEKTQKLITGCPIIENLGHCPINIKDR